MRTTRIRSRRPFHDWNSSIPRHGSFCLPAEAAATFFQTLFSLANYADHGNDFNASEFDHTLVGFVVSLVFDAFGFRKRALTSRTLTRAIEMRYEPVGRPNLKSMSLYRNWLTTTMQICDIYLRLDIKP